jgi:hypothetical protein
MSRTSHSSSRSSRATPARLVVVALALALLAPASASAAPGDSCPPGTALTPTYSFLEGRVKVPLVATHELTVIADFPDAVRHEALATPDGVRVIGRRGARVKLIVPVSASLAVTATWVQANGPDGHPDDPETNCTASATTALPIVATLPTRAFYVRKGEFGDAAFAVVPDRRRGDVSPLEVSVRTVARARFPSAAAKEHKMPVAMRPSEKVRYKRHIPQEAFATSPMICRFYLLTCGGAPLVNTRVSLLEWIPPRRRIRTRDLNGVALLSALQPFRLIAPYGVMVDALVGGRDRYKPPGVGFDVQVHQAGQLVGRARVALRCHPDPKPFPGVDICKPVKRAFG